MSIGKNIAKLRQGQGWTQVELAEKLEVHPNHIGRWEKNQMRPRPKMLQRIAEVLGVSLEELTAQEQDVPSRLSREDPALAELVAQIPQLDADQRLALRLVLHSMLTCRQLQDLASKRPLGRPA